VSPALAESLAKIVKGLEPAIVPNVVDTEFFRLPSSPVSRPIDVLYVGTLVKKKGVDLLLRAVAELVARGSPIHTRVIGDGPERGALEGLSASLGLVGRVSFTGAADRNGVREAMWRSRVFVLPSRVETFGLVVAEAMACGLPVVATVSGGPESFVRPPFGWLAPVENYEALAAAIASALA
jgi:glycosyltransferase involved in cell wall biosynthesis